MSPLTLFLLCFIGALLFAVICIVGVVLALAFASTVVTRMEEWEDIE